MLSQSVLDKLAGIDTPTVCNLIELFDVRPRNSGFSDSRIKACFPEMPAIVGYAATASLRADAPPRRAAASSLDAQVARFGELDGPAILVFQDLDDPPVAATFGEVMCSTYRAFGALGLITNGAGRDLAQVRELDFPVFANGVICSHGYNHIPAIHIPVRIGGLTVYPNDLLHADANGVTTIPVEIAADLADLGPEYLAAESVIIEAMKGPDVSVALLQEVLKESRAQIDRLRARVSRKVMGRKDCSSR